MRRIRLSKRQVSEPSLVPLADMLTNTVGIMLFILAFAVMAAGGAAVKKHLPILQKTEAKSLDVICTKDRVHPVRPETFDRFMKAFPEVPKPLTRSNADQFVADVNALRIQDEHITLRGNARVVDAGYQTKRLVISMLMSPNEDGGIRVADLDDPALGFVELLRANDPSASYVEFDLYPDALETFYRAREVATQLQYKSGWFPLEPGEALRVTFSGSGVRSGPQ